MHYPRNYQRFPDVTRIKNFVYDSRYGNYTKADLFFPSNRDKSKKLPVVVNVHGGGFVKGDKRHRKSICSEFAREGFFVYNINYRLAPQYALPSGCYDVINALNMLPSLADEYSLDLDKIVLTGDSAGGFYAMSAVLACVSEKYRNLLKIAKPSVTPSAYIGFCGAYRLGDILSRKTPLDMAGSIANALMGEKCDVRHIAEHANFAFTDLIGMVDGNFPRSMLVYSKFDDFCGGQGEALEQALIDNSVSVDKFVAIDKKDIHCFHLLPRHKTTPACIAKVKAFLSAV